MSEPEHGNTPLPLRRAILTFASGRQAGRSYDLSQPTTTIGRVCDNLVALDDDAEVSRRHAEIRVEADGHVLYDLRSSNGTYVNGQRVGRHILRHGDEIRIGRTLLTFQIDIVSPARAEEPASAPPCDVTPEAAGVAQMPGIAGVPVPDITPQRADLEGPGSGRAEPTGAFEPAATADPSISGTAEDSAMVDVKKEPAAPASLGQVGPPAPTAAVDVEQVESHPAEATPVAQVPSQQIAVESALQPALAGAPSVSETARREDETGRLLNEAEQMEEAGRLAEALMAYRHLASRLPHEGPLWREINLIAGNLEARLASPHAEAQRASKPADAAKVAEPPDGELALLMARAERLEAAGDAFEAAALYREASSRLPADSSLRQELGAVIDSLEARSAGRDEATELAARAQRLEAQGDMPGALAAYRQALAEVPAGSALHGELQSIVRDLERSASQRLEAHEGELRRAESLEKAGRWTEAAAIYREQLAEADDPSWRARWQAGMARCDEQLQLTKLYDDSLEACRRDDWPAALAGLQEVVRRRPDYQQDGYAAAAVLRDLQDRLSPAARARVPTWCGVVGAVTVLALLVTVAGGAYLITRGAEAGRVAATATAAADATRAAQQVVVAATTTTEPTMTATETPVPTATPTLAPVKPYPQHGFPLYSEDFDNPDNGWDRVTDDSADKDYQNGEYVVLAKRSNWPVEASGPKEVATDFTFEADVRLALDGSPHTRFGLTFRRKDQNNYYAFLITGDGRYGVWRIDDGRRSSLLDAEWTLTPHVQTGGTSNHLSVVCSGTRMSVYANGQFLVTVDDPTFEAGRVGFIVETDTDGRPPRVAFDNARLSVPYADVPPVIPLSPHDVLEISDDFGNPDSGWEQTQADTQIKGYVDGRYAMVVKQAGLAAPLWALGPDVLLSDFTLEVDARLVEGADDTRYGVVFWYADSNNYHVFYVTGDGRYGVTRVRDGKTSQIMAQEVPLSGKSPRSVRELRMVCEGTRASLYADSGYMGTVGFEAAGQGRIGLYVGAAEGAGPVTATFDNLRVLASASSVAQQPTPAVTEQPPTPTAEPAPPTPAATPTHRQDTTPAVLNRIAFVSNRDGNEEIYTMGPDGTGLVRLTDSRATDRYPAWSPDGARIAFVSDRDGNFDIYVMNNDGSNVTRLTDHPAVDAHPAWSPDGARIVFDSDRDSMMSDLFVMNADGSGLVKLQQWGRVAAWSPDGSRIAANFQFGDFAQLGLVPADGSGGPRPLLEVHMNNFPDWSPDGNRIAFESAIDSDNVEIMVINADGSNLVDLTRAPNFIDQHPSWSPDGTQIVFVSDRDGNDEIYLMNADGSGLQRLTDNPAWDSLPTWSP